MSLISFKYQTLSGGARRRNAALILTMNPQEKMRQQKFLSGFIPLTCLVPNNICRKNASFINFLFREVHCLKVQKELWGVRELLPSSKRPACCQWSTWRCRKTFWLSHSRSSVWQNRIIHPGAWAANFWFRNLSKTCIAEVLADSDYLSLSRYLSF